MKIIITGASGLVATELTVLLLERTSFKLTLVSRKPDELAKRYVKFSNRVETTTLSGLIDNHVSEGYDVVVHTAFARNASGASIAESLIYLSVLCKWIKMTKVESFINISSQSVYGNDYTPGIDENSGCAPDYLYALGKYSSELITEAWLSGTSTNIYQLRLASVCENARFIRIFIDNLLNNKPIRLTAPNQIVSFIDVRDVAAAIYKVITQKEACPGIYNLGCGSWYPIIEVAHMIMEIGRTDYNVENAEIIIDDNGTEKSIGMGVEKFQQSFNWKPEYNIKDMISSIYKMLTNVNGGGYPIAFKLVYTL